MLKEIIEHIVECEPDLKIVADQVPLSELEKMISHLYPNFVMCTTLDDRLTTLADQLMNKFPRLKFIFLENQGRTAYLYKMSPVKVLLGEITQWSLVKAIRYTE